jgi:hypothetical protein
VNQKILELVDGIHDDVKDMCLSEQRGYLNSACIGVLEKVLKLHTVMDRLIRAKEVGIAFDDAPIDIDIHIEHYKQTLEMINEMDLGEIR